MTVVCSKNNSPNLVNPLLPPIVRMTQNSIRGDSVYALSCFREPSVLNNVRLFLAYMHDQDNNICMEGKTKTYLKVSIRQEGLPNNYKDLLELFLKYYNSEGISTKDAKADLEAYGFQLMIFTETWLNDSFKNEEILDSTWSVYRNDRDYNSTGVMYFPPNSDESSYNNFFAIYNDIFKIMNEDDNIVILGDFNRPSLSFVIDDFDNQLLPINFIEDIDFDLISTFYGNDLQQVFRYPNSRGNWLDLAFSNAYDTINVRSDTDEENIFRNSIHHNALVLELPYSNHKFSNTYNNEIINSIMSNPKKFFDFVNTERKSSGYPISMCMNGKMSSSPTEICNFFADNFQQIYRPELPSNNVNFNPAPLVNNMNPLFEYFHLSINSIMSNPKKFFDFVNTKRKSSGYPISMCMNGKMSSSPTEICNFFADNFQQIYRPELPSNNVNFNPALLVNNTNPLFEYFHLSVENVFQGISSLDVKKGSGPDLLPPIFLYNCRYTLSNPLTSIFNRSISTGIFPSAWKNSYLILIHKKGDKTAIENYRGIAIQSAIPKLFEKLVTDILAPVINPLLNNEQHGFRTGRSTT
ncbi:uncharacterized protein LOC129615845 [Condylostylus longicornis]|uniref:uncharacterized protein LOC129615845 n=1 Tax=Condylostylus longicornis TaxID=2530218 RepID=UPI00244E40A6|nr:uncharacterized protein LOC129615845 [Condylostylus longicornis]